jgi:hypothetical protein
MTMYTGSCQCGAVTFHADLTLDGAVTCNCSRCQRLGSVLVFTPRDKFTLDTGTDSLTEYKFNRNVISHLFCKTCGIESFAYASGPDGTPMAAVNANCLEGVDPRALKAHHYDGRAV